MSGTRAGRYESTDHSQHSSTHGPGRPKSQHLTPGVYSHSDKITPGRHGMHGHCLVTGA